MMHFSGEIFSQNPWFRPDHSSRLLETTMQTMKQQMNIDHSCSGAKFDTTKQLPVFNWCYIMCLFLFLTYFHENNFDLILFPIYE